MKYYEGQGNCGHIFEFKITADHSSGWVLDGSYWMPLDDEQLGHLVNLIEKGKVNLVKED